MIAEDLNSEQILQRINNRIDIYKEWNYKLDDKWKIILPTEISLIGVEPNESSEITFVSLITDQNNANVYFYLNYIPCKASIIMIPFIFNFDLSKNINYPIHNQGLKYFFPINKSFKLSKIQMQADCTYKDIRAFNISSSNLEKSDDSIFKSVINCTLTVRYTQQQN